MANIRLLLLSNLSISDALLLCCVTFNGSIVIRFTYPTLHSAFGKYVNKLMVSNAFPSISMPSHHLLFDGDDDTKFVMFCFLLLMIIINSQ